MAYRRLRWWEWEKSIRKLDEEWRKTPPAWDQWMTAAQAMQALGCGRDALNRAISEGRLGAMKDVNRRWRIRAEDVALEKDRREKGRGAEEQRSGGEAADGNLSTGQLGNDEAGIVEGDSDSEVWISTAEAATMLGVTRVRVNKMARDGKLSRRLGKQRRATVLLSEVSAMIAERDEAAFRRCSGRKDYKRNRERREWLRRWAQEPMRPDDMLISCAEAAEILDVSKPRMSALVTAGVLWAYQSKPGVQGSRMRFRLSRVLALADRPEWQRRHAAAKRGAANPASEQGGWEEYNLPTLDPRLPSANTERDYGEFFTTRQAAMALGVCPKRVHALRESGRLKGIVRTRVKPGKSVNPWWFYKKDDVYALMADPSYCAHRRRWKKGLAELARVKMRG